MRLPTFLSKWVRQLLCYPNIGKALSTLAGFLEVPLLQTMFFLEKRNRSSKFREHFTKFYKSHVIPLNISLESIPSISPTEEILEIIRRVDALGIGYCYCRSKSKNCDNDVWTCIHVGTAESLHELSERMPIKSASVHEVEELLHRCDEVGLVHQLLTAPNQDYFYVICNCCPCCCVMLGSMLKHGITHAVLHSNFVSLNNWDLCDSCGECTSRCYFGARQMEKNEFIFDSSKCVGCGLCVTECNNKAISMLRRINLAEG